jgi:hypothetical protein
MDEQQRPISPEGSQGRDKAQNEMDKVDRYVFVWLGEEVIEGANTIDEIIEYYKSAIKDLQAMKNAGVVLDDESTPVGKDARLITTDPAVAKRFGFWEDDKAT